MYNENNTFVLNDLRWKAAEVRIENSLKSEQKTLSSSRLQDWTPVNLPLKRNECKFPGRE